MQLRYDRSAEKYIDVRSTIVGKTNPPPVGIQNTGRVRNLKMQRSGNAEVRRAFGDMAHIGT